MIKDNASPRSCIGADKNYDTADFVAGCRKGACRMWLKNNIRRRSAIDARTTRHAGYKVSKSVPLAGEDPPAKWTFQQPARI
jgi:hypothetical protein